MARKYFGTDGIRGRANGVITPELALRVGQAAGLVFLRGDHRHRVVIGKDTRLSGYMIESALQAGFTSVGMDVLLLGPMPTPAVAMLTRSMRADLGVMISASHNPFDDNGIKLFGPDGYKLSDDVEMRIEQLLDEDLTRKLANSASIGRARRIDGTYDRYIEFAKRTLSRSLSLEGLRIVVDCAHGAAYKVVPEALWELGADVIAIGVDPDGFNINKDCGSTAPEALGRKVREMRADIGIALDGDADRVIITDERGHIVDGDQLLAVIAESWKDDGRLSQPAVVATVMSNLGLERYLAGIGLKLIRTQVGDRYVLEQMLAQNCNVGGEVVRSHHPVRVQHHRRRLRRSTAGALGGAQAQSPGVRSLPSFRSAAAGAEERPLPQRQAARRSVGEIRHRCRRRQAERQRPPAGPRLRHRAGDPRDGRGRRSRAGRGYRRFDLCGGRRGRGGVSDKSAAFDPAAHRLVQEQRWFEDFKLGERFVLPSRTMTDAIFLAFQAASGDNHPVHYDVEYCRRHGMPHMLAHGFQVLIQTAAGAGLFPHLVEDSLKGFIEQSSKFLGPGVRRRHGLSRPRSR